jgi:hypothetical protein
MEIATGPRQTAILCSGSHGTRDDILLSHDFGSRATTCVGSGKLLLVVGSRIIFGSKSRGTHDRILLFRDSGIRKTPHNNDNVNVNNLCHNYFYIYIYTLKINFFFQREITHKFTIQLAEMHMKS